MSFKNLEQRFTENVEKLYAGATQKFAGGKPSNGRADEPLITREIGTGYFGKTEDRSIPINSTKEDVRRLTLFQLSNRGIRFLAKQQLLQTGNTFQITRNINPAFIVKNAVPFIHVKRNLRPLNELTRKTDTSRENVRKLGQLQVESYNKLKAWKRPDYIQQHLNQTRSSNTRGLLSTIGGILGGIVKTAVQNTISNALGPLLAVNPFQNRNVGDKFGYDASGWQKTRPELADTIIASVATANLLFQENVYGGANKVNYVKYFNSPDGLKMSMEGNRGDGPTSSKITRQPNDKKLFSYVKDPANTLAKKPNKTADPYKDINNDFEDMITVSFAMGKEDPIKFRAFIKDINQSTSPQYNTFQYIGRIEKFVTYTGVQREVSLKLALVAFSITELDMVWKRINYLTGLAFPYGFSSGILQPNIARITLGKIYENQPVYLTSLNTIFNDTAESWEIDPKYQVPIAATMDMRFVLIEKSTKIASSPFYGITDSSLGFGELPIPTKVGSTKGKDSLDLTKDMTFSPPDVNLSTWEGGASVQMLLNDTLSRIPKANKVAAAVKTVATRVSGTSANPIKTALTSAVSRITGTSPNTNRVSIMQPAPILNAPTLANARLNQAFQNYVKFVKPSSTIPTMSGRG